MRGKSSTCRNDQPGFCGLWPRAGSKTRSGNDDARRQVGDLPRIGVGEPQQKWPWWL